MIPLQSISLEAFQNEKAVASPEDFDFRFVLSRDIRISQLGFSLVNSRVGPVLKYKGVMITIRCLSKMRLTLSSTKQ